MHWGAIIANIKDESTLQRLLIIDFPSSKKSWKKSNKKGKAFGTLKNKKKRQGSLSSSLPGVDLHDDLESSETDVGSMSNVYILTQMITEESLERQVAEKKLGVML